MTKQFSNPRVQAAAFRSIEAANRNERLADRLLAEIDEVTPVNGIPMTDLSDEDSMVIAVKDGLAANSAPPKKRAKTEPGRAKTDNGAAKPK